MCRQAFRILLTILTGIAWGLVPGSSGADNDARPTVQVVKQEEGLTVRGRILVPASREAVWAVVTDFDNLAAFNPSLKVSRVVGRDPDGSIQLEQVSRQGVLFFHREVRVLLRVELEPMEGTRYALIEGDFRTYEGNWRLAPAEGGIEVSLTLRMVPDFFAPDFIQRRVAEKGAAEALEAVRREVLRRRKEGDR